MTTTSALRILSAAMFLSCAVAGCAVEEEEPEATSESALKNAPDGTLQFYSMNTHHMSQPGTPSFEVTDWRQMIAYMREQTYLPDIILLSEVGRNNSVPSQPCNVFVNRLEKTLSPKGKIEWKCEQAKGSTNALDNAGGGTAIVYRKNLVPLERKTFVQWTYHDGKCIPDPTGPGLTFVQTFKDGKRTVAVASLHLVSPTVEGGTNQYSRDCSEKNLAEITAALKATKADAMVLGGDMNHADAKRHLEGATIVHDHWEAGYVTAKKAGFEDPWFDDCEKKCGDGKDACISVCVAETTSVGRIDWLLARGAKKLKDNVSIPFADARASYVRQTGDANAVEKYSDHLAQRMLVVY